MHLSPAGLLYRLKKTVVAESVTASERGFKIIYNPLYINLPRDVSLRDQIKADGADVVHVALLTRDS